MIRLAYLFVLGIFLASISTAQATDLFVDDGGSDTANNCQVSANPCQTIQNALDQSADGDTIFVAPGTYNAGSGASDTIVDIVTDVTIQGDAADTTILDGNDSDRVVSVAPDTTVTIADVTIQNGADSGTGDEGAGIRNNGILNLDNSTVQNNNGGTGGGIFNGQPPGAPLPGGSLIITNCTISGNTSTNTGGGISNGGAGIGDPDYTGTLIMVNSTVSGNTSSVNPGGMGGGGGIYNHTGSTATLLNVTVANNTANASSTAQGGGGVQNNGTMTVDNTLIADNSDNSSANAEDCQGTLGSTVGYNLVEDLTGCTLSGTTTANVTGTDPNLGGLADNGGTTMTHALLAFSEAIDAGNPASCKDNAGAVLNTDQRGSTRPTAGIQGNVAICDIGAFEAAAGTTPSGGGGSGGCRIGQGSGASLGFAGLAIFASLLAVARRRQSQRMGS